MIGDEFTDDSVVFPSAGLGAVFSEVVHFSVDSDISSAGGFVKAVFWQLFSCLGHLNCSYEKSVTDTLYQEFKSLANFDLSP